MKILEPISLGTMRLRNRFVMSPMISNFATVDGYVTQRMKDYYAARAEGGAAMIIVEATCVEACGRVAGRQLMIDDDTHIAGLKELASAIRKHGAKACIQIYHSGRVTSSGITGCQPIAPSAIPYPGDELVGVHDIFETPRALTIPEIKEQEYRYVEAVVRAKKAGFDAVELHCAHGYLINQFLSPNSNKRTDEYGGDLKNRARFMLETIAEIKKAVGNSYPIICRINGDEPRIENGGTVKDAQEISKLCQDAGVAAIDVSCLAGPDNSFSPMVAKKKGFLLELSAAVKKSVTIPVMGVYRLTPEVAEQAINEGKADIAVIGRGLLADPEMPNKVARGKASEVTPCIVCNTCQYNLLSADDNIKCRVNPAAGKERDMAVTKAKKAKKITVVGGGPAGLEAATIAALRGHKVTLFEKEKTLGGQLIIAAVPPHKDILIELIDSLSSQAKAAGVNILLGRDATVSEINSTAPDEIVLATGILPFVPEIRGVHSPNVVSADDVLAGKATLGKRVIVLGGELVGCETAEMLAEKGKKVTITRRSAEMAMGLSPMNRASLLGRLQAAGVTMMPSVIYNEITAEGLKVIDKDGKMQTLPADTIVLAAGYQPNTKLFDLLNDKTGKVHCIGDCQKPRSLLEAMIEGHGIGRTM